MSQAVSYTHLDVYKRQTLHSAQLSNRGQTVDIMPFSKVCTRYFVEHKIHGYNANCEDHLTGLDVSRVPKVELAGRRSDGRSLKCSGLAT